MERQARSEERGNVLFLILIAVALFAALSYAVTASTRSSGSSSSNETTLISSAQVTQYPAGARTAAVRMIMSGVTIDVLEFNPPSTFGSLFVDTLGRRSRGVFHPDGGGATYTVPPAEQTTTGNESWHFNADVQIQNVGITNPPATAGGDSNELVAWLCNPTLALCQKINRVLGINVAGVPTNVGVPDVAGMPATLCADDMVAGGAYTFPVVDGPIIGGAAGDVSLKGQAFGCFTDVDNGNKLVYYHTLVER